MYTHDLCQSISYCAFQTRLLLLFSLIWTPQDKKSKKVRILVHAVIKISTHICSVYTTVQVRTAHTLYHIQSIYTHALAGL